MDAEELTKTLEDCKNQISAVEEALQNGDSEEIEQLQRLKSDLSELAELTESQLLDLKKAQMLGQFGSDSDQTQSEWTESEHSPDVSAESEAIASFLQEVVGTKCRAPINLGPQLPRYHNAVIMELGDETDAEITDISQLPVKVLFCSPMTRAMQPCRFFLENKCNYENCKFSHGKTVEFKDLMEFEDIDYKNLAVGDMCLARSETTELFEQARITSISESEKQVAVTLIGSGFEKALDFGEIVPLLPDPEIESSPEAPTSSNNVLSSTNSISEGGRGDQFLPPTTLYGDWEKHTKGFGSRLLQKMGYVEGRGLGKSGAGITEPVQVRMFPKGKSLDYCMRKKGKLNPNNKLDVKALTKSGIGTGSRGARCPSESGIFNFINSKLRETGKSKSMSSATKSAHQPGNSLNVQLLQIEEAKKKTRIEISRLKTSLARNESKDIVAASKIREKLSAAQDRLTGYSKSETILNREKTVKNDKKKLSIF